MVAAAAAAFSSWLVGLSSTASMFSTGAGMFASECLFGGNGRTGKAVMPVQELLFKKLPKEQSTRMKVQTSANET
ncbi:hypothetical protein BJ741DRAFT_612562 [Chytriomyces cf. hyalinus JEL632]|nr:hypothetical protein BJ741DRAFT_612562 [Chytriomyces cf. hyalinus JEL632]